QALLRPFEAEARERETEGVVRLGEGVPGRREAIGEGSTHAGLLRALSREHERQRGVGAFAREAWRGHGLLTYTTRVPCQGARRGTPPRLPRRGRPRGTQASGDQGTSPGAANGPFPVPSTPRRPAGRVHGNALLRERITNG